MPERALFVVGLAALVVIASLAARVFARRRTAAARGQRLPEALRDRLPDRGPGIVYFYGPHCGTCPRQSAILDRLSDDGVPVVRVDATNETALADVFAVMTVPATVVVDNDRTVRAVNLGLRSREELTSQLRDLTAIRPRESALYT